MRLKLKLARRFKIREVRKPAHSSRRKSSKLELSAWKGRSEVTPPPLPAVVAPSSTKLAVARLIHPDAEFKSSVDAFLKDLKSKHTRRAYEADLKRFIKYLLVRKYAGGLPEIDRTVIVSYKDFLKGEGLSEISIDRHLATLRSFFGWLKDDGLISDNPAERVRFLNPRRLSPTRGFSDEEVTRVLQMPDLHSRIGALHYAMLVVLFYCGLRRSELAALTVGALISERGKRALRVIGKGNAERLIPLKPRVVQAIEYYLTLSGRDVSQERREGALFQAFSRFKLDASGRPKSSGTFIDPSLVFYVVRRYARMAGITEKVSPHSCRATAISHARDRRIPDRAIQEFAGWTSTTMITQYDKRKTAIEDSAAHVIDYETELAQKA